MSIEYSRITIQKEDLRKIFEEKWPTEPIELFTIPAGAEIIGKIDTPEEIGFEYKIQTNPPQGEQKCQ